MKSEITAFKSYFKNPIFISMLVLIGIILLFAFPELLVIGAIVAIMGYGYSKNKSSSNSKNPQGSLKPLLIGIPLVIFLMFIFEDFLLIFFAIIGLIALTLLFLNKKNSLLVATSLNSMVQSHKLFFGGAIFGVGVLLVIFRPFVHAPFMLVYTTPLLWPALLLAIILVLLAKNSPRKQSKLEKILLTTGKIVAVLSVISIIGWFFFSEALLYSAIIQTTTYAPITQLPETSQYRLLPRGIAETLFVGTLADSTQRVGNLDIAMIDNTLSWTAPKIPNGELLYFTAKPKGLLIANATTSGKNISSVTQDLQIGEGIGIFDNIYWHVYSKDYLMDISEIFYLVEPQSRDIITIAPVIRYSLEFPIMRPYFDGIYLILPDGTTRFVKNTKIGEEPLLANAPVFPEFLARMYVNAFQYKKGILNAWFYHEDQIEISDVPDQLNQQPFLLPTVNGIKWVVATQPSGEVSSNYGIFKIFLVDAVTGHIELYEIDPNNALLGPTIAINFAKKEAPLIDWSSFILVEPRPYFVEGDLYWLVSLVPNDFTGVSSTVLINAQTSTAQFFSTDSELKEFLQGNAPTPTPQTIAQEQGAITTVIENIESQLAVLKQLVSNKNK